MSKKSEFSKSTGLRRLAGMIGVSGALFAAAPAHALLVNMQNFNSLADFTLNGVTATIDTGGVGVVGPNVGDERVLRLTNNYAQSGSAVLTNASSLASDASFSS